MGNEVVNERKLLFPSQRERERERLHIVGLLVKIHNTRNNMSCLFTNSNINLTKHYPPIYRKDVGEHNTFVKHYGLMESAKS